MQWIRDYINEHIMEAEELLETLGRIPAPSHQEDMRAKFCKDWFEKQGAKNVWIDQAKNCICAIDIDKYDEIVVFAAHTDIVFPDLEALPVKKDGRKLYAPGIGDDTANLVNLMMGAKYFLTEQKSMRKGVLFVANACEEGLGNLEGCKALFKEYGHRIKYFYSFDGYLSQCTSIPVGSYRYRVTVQGEGGHSYLDFGNQNAIHIAAKLINDLYSVKVPKNEKTTFNVGQIDGGTTVNSIAQKATLLYEYRSSSQECLEMMEENFNSIISKYKREGFDLNVEILGIRPGKGIIDEKAMGDWTQRNIDIIKKYYNGNIDCSPYSTDSNIPLSQGICANTIGTIVGQDAHKREEWVDLDSLPTGMKIVLELMNQYTA